MSVAPASRCSITYVVTTRVRRREDGEEVLVVEADQQHTEDRWTGEFTRQCERL